MDNKKIEIGLGQESVWEYPRPPKLEKSDKHIEVFFNNVLIADSSSVLRVLETSHPPVYYIPPEDVVLKHLVKNNEKTFCEWKGTAYYYDIEVWDRIIKNAAWYYSDPAPGFVELRDYIAFYPGGMDTCFVDGEIARSQPGDFYGGWITSDVVGPFKGDPGTEDW